MTWRMRLFVAHTQLVQRNDGGVEGAGERGLVVELEPDLSFGVQVGEVGFEGLDGVGGVLHQGVAVALRRQCDDLGEEDQVILTGFAFEEAAAFVHQDAHGRVPVEISVVAAAKSRTMSTLAAFTSTAVISRALAWSPNQTSRPPPGPTTKTRCRLFRGEREESDVADQRLAPRAGGMTDPAAPST